MTDTNQTSPQRPHFDAQRAIDFAREHSITGVEIAVKFTDSDFEETFAIPVAIAEPAHSTA